MNAIATTFLLFASVALIFLPRRWAPLPLLAGACYMTLGQGIEIGPFHFTVFRMIVLVWVIRMLLRGERPGGGLVKLDWVMAAWAAAAILSSPFHAVPVDALVFRLGIVFDTLGIYFLTRAFCQRKEDVVHFIKIIALVLVPVALAMLSERFTQRNLFSVFGGVEEAVTVRDGKLRAQGPFLHPILAGTVGAVCAPLIAGISRTHPVAAKLGVAACLGMVITSSSSGPIMSLLSAGFALAAWHWRHLTRQMRVAGILGYILLDIVMNQPAYYILAKIDLTGSSTGWHRARLIESAFEHLGEWWWAGTDKTRHWMASGVAWNTDHTDITNYYLRMGVNGGLPLMLLFIWGLWVSFQYVGHTLRVKPEMPTADQFTVWAIGSSLFAQAVTCVSVSYFDQSFLFLYTCLGMLATLKATIRDVFVDE